VERAFERVVLNHSGEDFIERDWLTDHIDRALSQPGVSLVLVTGERGTGKTSLLARLAGAHPDWLRYFVSGESGDAPATGDLFSFLLSIGQQLAAQRPALLEADGNAAGIRTAYLEPRLKPDKLAGTALLGPADVLSKTDPAAGIVILLDALDGGSRTDHAASLLEWLATGPRLPGNVKIVVTSRPGSALGLLRAGRTGQVEEILLDADVGYVSEDLASYAERALSAGNVARAAAVRHVLPGQFPRQAARQAGGNFLYLTSYVRALKDAVASDDAEMMDRLFKLDDLPETLFGLYGLLVELAKVRIDRLGLLDIEDPRSPADQHVRAWEGVGRPILGVLAVAREPLTEAQLMQLAGTRVPPRSVQHVLARLRWLLRRHGGTVALCHASVGEFLTGPLAWDHDCWPDPADWHERIVRHYRGSAVTWAEADWPAMDLYGLAYLPGHVLGAGPGIAEQAPDLICGGYLRAVRAEFGVVRPFIEAVDQVAEHVIETRCAKDGLEALIYLGTVRCQTARGARALPTRLAGLMVRLGRVNEALERTAELPPSFHRFAAMLEIAHYAECGPGSPTREELNERCIEYALMIPPHEEVFTVGSALRFAAQSLAPYDCDHAMLLWDRARAEQRHQAESPDWSAYLHLACRLADSGRARRVLADAEENLTAVAPAARVRGIAGLAKRWHSIDPDRAARLIAELRAEVFQAGEDKDLPQALADAAEVIEPVDPATARMLLTRLDFDSEVTDQVLLAAAVLWRKWGLEERARAVTDRLSGPDPEGWRQYKLTATLGELRPDSALESLEDILAAIPDAGAEPGTPEGRLRTRRLVPVIAEVARYDLARAAEIARQAPEAEQHWGGEFAPFPWLREGGSLYADDRHSMLAAIAHAYLDRGERARAMALLDEALAPDIRRPGASGDTVREESASAMADFNPSEDWRGIVKRHFFRGPADVVRAASASPGSLARILRVAAEQIWPRDRATATRVMRTIDDAGERAIGLSALHIKSHDPNHGPESDRLSRELDQALAELSSHHQTSSRPPSGSRQAMSYARPDIRAHFEVALGAIDCRGQDAEAIKEFEYLTMASKFHMYLHIVDHYTASLLEGRRVPQDFMGLIERALSPRWFEGQQHKQLIDSTRAAIAYREYQIVRELPGHAPATDRIKIQDPIYATAMDLVAPTSDGALSPTFEAGIRRLLTRYRVAAAAEMLEFAAEIRPEAEPALLRLAEETIAATEGMQLVDRIDALSHLASSPILGELLDPADLIDEAQWTVLSGSRLMDAAVARLFPVLLRRSPSAAMRGFYQVASARWSHSMSLLESSVGQLLEIYGLDIAERVAWPVQQALGCVAADGKPPESADGVSFASLLPAPRVRAGR
jgi:tetratricopeptide (TPR) repeat protein